MDRPSGHDAEPPNWLFPFQRPIVKWALRRGRAAIFADTGLGKTAMQVAWADNVARHTGGRVLIAAPLSVAHQTARAAAEWGVEIAYARNPADTAAQIVITNYEMMHRFDVASYAGVVLDESSILKSHDGKTRTALIESCRAVPYRLSCTATPSPNDHMELGNQAEFLGVMSRDEMLAMYFTHDGGSTSQWRLKGHGRTRFWEWMATWAVVIRRPSDLGFDDEGYDLPPMIIHEHVVSAPATTTDNLFERPAMTLTEQRQAKRASMDSRVAGCAEVVAQEPDEPWLVWCHLNDESAALAKAIPGSVPVAGADSIAHKEASMDGFTDGAVQTLISKPSICGFGMNWQHCSRIAFAGLDHSFRVVLPGHSPMLAIRPDTPRGCTRVPVRSRAPGAGKHTAQGDAARRYEQANGGTHAPGHAARGVLSNLRAERVHERHDNRKRLDGAPGGLRGGGRGYGPRLRGLHAIFPAICQPLHLQQQRPRHGKLSRRQ
ncbi:MAG: SNF2-related protein [Arhodomonas sp.]|nr:SNF2-related protein [Arhodomonas sp.]